MSFDWMTAVQVSGSDLSVKVSASDWLMREVVAHCGFSAKVVFRFLVYSVCCPYFLSSHLFDLNGFSNCPRNRSGSLHFRNVNRVINCFVYSSCWFRFPIDISPFA